MEGRGLNTTPCRLSKTAEAASSTLEILREFVTNRTKEPVIYLICKKADDETETELSLQEQLSDAKEKIDDLEDNISKLQEQLKKFEDKVCAFHCHHFYS